MEMKKEEIILRLKELIIEVGELDISVEELKEQDKNILDNYNFNSILALEYLLKVEECFDIEIEDDYLDGRLLNDLEYLAEYVENKNG